ncbi:hypothetical protein [Halomarina rubra]|uniref:Uncharacterized protein n=1 Tax=Halomarina rubra TaxID=2071873 RepID=A0ABD6B0W9_9EURY|nr:hypothetical protein [Halomarina rubra]
MPSLTLAALSAEFRTLVESLLVATALFVLFTLFAPDPTDPLVMGPATVLAVLGGAAVAHRAKSTRTD